MNTRILIQKKQAYDVESQHQLANLQKNISIQHLKISYIYDLFDINENDLPKAIENVFSNPVTDKVLLEYQYKENTLAVEYLPGNYDQRADSAEQCLAILGIENVRVLSSVLYEFDGVSEEDIIKLKESLINPIESREKDLNVLEFPVSPEIKPVPIIHGFIQYNEDELSNLHQQFGFSFELDDLLFIQEHFKSIERNPTETELKMLDTYWSDHCRHTTFETEITNITIESQFQNIIQNTLDYYLKLREELNITKPIRLMDLATIMGKYFIKTGVMNNIEISEEVNACSIEITVDEDGKEEEWLLMFKNETHNHPTEVEPFGGASTCVGGAIRDPLSGRAFVYQAMRVTGSANPLEKIEDTLEGKLPQYKITTEAAKGYSSYGNQIGLATTHVREIYDEGYKAKRMEVGFVAGAVKKEWVRRESPVSGDKIILLGGKTGRDGIGGATGSSKVHDGQKLSDLSAEVQKGNAPVERKIQRLFKQEEVIRMIKKCNDFGAGGVSVAIGEISDGVSINLDVIPTKYSGLNGTELAISESQERMAVVVEDQDVEKFIKLAEKENLEAVEVAEVTDDNHVSVLWKGEKIVHLDRNFLDTNGVRKQTQLKVVDSKNIQNPFENKEFTKENFIALLEDLNHTSQKGLVEMFDCNVGRSTVLAPFGGKNQETPEDVSVQKIPTKGFTNTVSMASFGFNPKVSKWSCYHGGYYAVIDSVAKIVAAGGNYEEIRLTFQEYFERLRNEENRWGKPFASLLGTIEAQKMFNIAAIGGKDSMSGTYHDIDVPPTLISFAVAPNDVRYIISSTLQRENTYLYAFVPPMSEGYLLDEKVITNFYKFTYDILGQDIVAMKAVEFGGIAESLSKMAFGNKIGFEVKSSLPMMQYLPGALLFEIGTTIELGNELDQYLYPIGQTNTTQNIKINGVELTIEEALKVWTNTLEPVFPSKTNEKNSEFGIQNSEKLESKRVDSSEQSIMNSEQPKVVIPVFPGTNSEYDSQKAFEKEGASVKQVLIRNLNSIWIEESLNEWVTEIEKADIIFIPGGFSAADEPEGSGKFIATVLRNEKVKKAIHDFLDRDGLILGICNGFQALIKSGLLPTGRISDLKEDSPTLYYNDIGRHVTQFVRTKVVNDHSPWLKGMKDQTFWVPVSHGEGKFIVDETNLKQLIENKQIATQYVDLEEAAVMEMPYNPNGSTYAIEGITSPCGRIYGRMGHPERVEAGTFKNIPNLEVMNIFKNGVEYVKQKLVISSSKIID
ncbi:phosphoribosylformylglycinamidine synthase [Flavobacteriaceae bacterium UJ101]|nr:phosphoribosylformylglycinamidine synthase [Flavobacteriaceae bacterium UJ101]